MAIGRKYIDYVKPDRLPTCAAEAWTIAEHMDLVLRESQADMVARAQQWLRDNRFHASLSQGQLSAVRCGREPDPCYWPLYQAALQIDDPAQFYRLMRNSAKIAGLHAPVSDTPLFERIVFADCAGARIVKLREEILSGTQRMNEERREAV